MASISTSIDPEKMGRHYDIFLSDKDFAAALSDFSTRERQSFAKLMGGSLAEKSLALTMILYTLEQNADKQEQIEKYKRIE